MYGINDIIALKTANMDKKSRDVYIVTYDDVNILDASRPAQVFTQANYVDSNLSIDYKIKLVSLRGGLIKTNSGISVNTDKLSSVPKEGKTIIVAGGSGVHKAKQVKALVNTLKKYCLKSNRIASVCTGSFLLASTGILNGKRAVTHWRSVDKFQQQFPDVLVERNPIYICDQGIWTSAGITAGIDLALAMVKKDLGHNCSLETAREMVVYLKRSGGQSQFSIPLINQSNDKQDIFNELHDWILNNLGKELSVELLATKMNMSQRTFFRKYKKIIGLTPAKSIEKIRIETAKEKLEQSVISIPKIARLCGFNNNNRFRRAFKDEIGITPQEYRTQFKAS